MQIDLLSAIIGAVAISIVAPIVNKILNIIELKQKMFLEKKFAFYEMMYAYLGAITHNATDNNASYFNNVNKNFSELFKKYANNGIYLSNKIDKAINKIFKAKEELSKIPQELNLDEFNKRYNEFIILAIKCRVQIKKEMSSFLKFF